MFIRRKTKSLFTEIHVYIKVSKRKNSTISSGQVIFAVNHTNVYDRSPDVVGAKILSSLPNFLQILEDSTIFSREVKRLWSL